MSNLKTQLAKRVQNNTSQTGQGVTLNALIRQDNIKSRFQELLGQKAPGFLSSLLNVVNSSNQLKQCNPQEILASAAIAAALDLPIDPNLGFAYIVPYRERNVYRPQFQMGYRGFVQLALRTGMYKNINATHVYEGEIERYNRITGEVVFSDEGAISDKIVGYIAYFKLLNGFEKYEYWTVDQVKAHAKRFSAAYKSDKPSPWTTDFDAMATKTVLKHLLSRYGILSIEMQAALKADQAVVVDSDEGEPNFEYIDNVTIEGEFSEVSEADEDSIPEDRDLDAWADPEQEKLE